MTKDEWLRFSEAVAGQQPASERNEVESGLLRLLAPLENAAARAAEARDAATQTRSLVLSRPSEQSQHPPGELRSAPLAVLPAVEQLLGGRTTAATAPVFNAPTVRRDTGSDDGSLAGTVVRTAAMVAGVGPVITGLLKLFGGGGGSKPADYSPVPFSLPEQISVEAGLAGDRSLADVSYSSHGLARSTVNRPSAPPAQIQVNVQAMDSRSFLDHSDEIARAVRDAMLRSHGLNDVIAEM